MEYPVFDREKALACYGSESVLEAVIRQYLGEAGAMVSILRTAIERGEREEIRRVVHWFRGGMSYLFAPATEQVCRELDTLTRGETVPPLGETTSRLQYEMDRLCAALKDDSPERSTESRDGSEE